MRLSALACLLMCLALPAAAQAQDSGGPIYLPVEEFGTFGPQNVSNAGIVTAEEEKRIEEAVASMEAFPRYLYSGCHDRAHAAYVLLPADLRPKVSKIWVIGPARYTAAIPGTIRLRAEDPASRGVDWGYHVALMINTNSGMRVFDPALRPGATITREQWFQLMATPRLSLWTVTTPKVYLFNYAVYSPAARNGTQVWNGNANDYDLYAPSDKIIPDNLARDAIGVDAVAGTACPALRAKATDPQGLLDMLRAGAAAAGCAASFTKFRAEKQRWAAKLGS